MIRSGLNLILIFSQTAYSVRDFSLEDFFVFPDGRDVILCMFE